MEVAKARVVGEIMRHLDAVSTCRLTWAARLAVLDLLGDQDSTDGLLYLRKAVRSVSKACSGQTGHAQKHAAPMCSLCSMLHWPSVAALECTSEQPPLNEP